MSRRKRWCPHVDVRGIYGDEALRTGYRLWCADCERFLDGPVSIAVDRQRLIQERRSEILREAPWNAALDRWEQTR